MRPTRPALTAQRFVVAYVLAGVAFVAVLLLSAVSGIASVLFLALPLAAACAVLFALSRMAWFRDALRGMAEAPSHLVTIALVGIVLLWAASLTGFHERVSAFNAGAPLTAGLVIDVIATGLLVAAALIAGGALTSRDVPDMGIVHTFAAANVLMLVHALAPAGIADLPAGPHPLIPLAAIALMAVPYLRLVILFRGRTERTARDGRR